MITAIIIIYVVCCVIGLAFSISGMHWSSERRPLGRNDLYAAIFFTCSGFVGTGVLLYLLIPEIIKTYKQVKAKENADGHQC